MPRSNKDWTRLTATTTMSLLTCKWRASAFKCFLNDRETRSTHVCRRGQEFEPGFVIHWGMGRHVCGSQTGQFSICWAFSIQQAEDRIGRGYLTVSSAPAIKSNHSSANDPCYISLLLRVDRLSSKGWMWETAVNVKVHLGSPASI